MFFVWLIILGLAQATVFQEVNFLVVLAIFAGLKKGPVLGLVFGSLIGVFTEVLSSSAFGLNLILFSIIGFLSGVLKAHIYYKENIFTEFLFSFFGVLFFYLVCFIFTKAIRQEVFFIALFSAIISPVLFRVID